MMAVKTWKAAGEELQLLGWSIPVDNTGGVESGQVRYPVIAAGAGEFIW